MTLNLKDVYNFLKEIVFYKLQLKIKYDLSKINNRYRFILSVTHNYHFNICLMKYIFCSVSETYSRTKCNENTKKCIVYFNYINHEERMFVSPQFIKIPGGEKSD